MISHRHNGTIFAVDYGFSKMGLAVGNLVTYTASPLAVLPAKEGRFPPTLLQGYLRSWQPFLIVVGLPYDMYGKEDELTLQARAFALWLSESPFIQSQQIEVVMHDERLTTVEAKRLKTPTKRKAAMDAIAAVVLLEDYLQTLSPQAPQTPPIH